jgi:hypothetical protein
MLEVLRTSHNNVSISELKERFISHFFIRLSQIDFFPTINIVFKSGERVTDETQITHNDIPEPKVREEFSLSYKRASLTKEEKVQWKESKKEEEKFEVFVFLLPENTLDKNQECFVSRGEQVNDAGLKLAKSSEKINGLNHYFVAITGRYIDNHVSDARGELDIPTKASVKDTLLKKRESLLEYEDNDEYIVIDRIQERAREICVERLPELETGRKELRASVETICARYGISKKYGEEALKRLTTQDEKKKIFKTLYQTQAVEMAKKEAALDFTFDEILTLDSKNAEYEECFREKTDEFFRTIPEQNKETLAHYFARRRLVVEVFERILKREMDVQKDAKRSEDERLIHNTLFRQRTANPRQSDLWVLDEEFVYYSGTSDTPLKDVEFNGKKLLRDLSDCSEEDREYLASGGENRTRKRPDILLYPEEGKCIIIELKSPEVNISDCLGQVNKYAGLIYAYCADELPINRFYTYVIGENLNFRDVRLTDSLYKPARNFGYLYGMRAVVADGKPDADQYMEAHSYSTILERAKLRNKIFFDFLAMTEEDI